MGFLALRGSLRHLAELDAEASLCVGKNSLTRHGAINFASGALQPSALISIA